MKMGDALAYLRQHEEPPREHDGRCSLCIGGLCLWHRAHGRVHEEQQRISMRQFLATVNERRIEYTMAAHELESDEAGTAETKARRIINGQSPIPHRMMSANI